MSNNRAQPLSLVNRLKEVADEHSVGGAFEGESKRERSVGHSRDVVVDIFKRVVGVDLGSYFLRVSLRSMVKPNVISRFEIDVNKYTNEKDFLDQVAIGGASVAIADIENRGATWDPDYVANQAVAAGRELLTEISNSDNTRGL